MTQTSTPTITMTSKHKVRNPAWLLLLAGLLLLLIWLGLKIWRISNAAQLLLDRQTELETLMDSDPLSIDPNQAEALILDSRRDILTIKRESKLFLPLTPYLGWLPKVGPTAVQAPHLLEMADTGTEAAAFAMRGLKPMLITFQAEGSSEDQLAQMIHLLNEATPDLAQTKDALDRFITARNQLEDPSELPWQLRELLTQIDPLLPLAQEGLLLTQLLPELAGINGERRYLILAQNNDELRATGGFISGAGLLVIENGRITTFTFQDGNSVDNWQDKPYELLTSGPLYDLMGLQLFFFRDANLWPDYPTSAETTMNLFSYGLDLPPMDGMIAIDQKFLQLLLQATGPVTIPDEDLTINSNNLYKNLQQAWAINEGEDSRDWIKNRKSFLGPFAAALQEKILSDFGNIDPALLATNILQAIETKHLQIYMRDPAVAAILQQLEWDGRLQTAPQQDFLMVVDMNVGYTKPNSLINRSITYNVILDKTGSGLANLNVEHQHSGTPITEPCDQLTNYHTIESYAVLINRCYWNYLRIYTPANSHLLTTTDHAVPIDSLLSKNIAEFNAQTVNETEKATTFTNFLLLAPNQTLTTQFQYQLPTNLVSTTSGSAQYQLHIQKQAGTSAQPLNISITLPDGAIFDGAEPAPTAVNGNIFSFILTLDKDVVITINYKKHGD